MVGSARGEKIDAGAGIAVRKKNTKKAPKPKKKDTSAKRRASTTRKRRGPSNPRRRAKKQQPKRAPRSGTPRRKSRVKAYTAHYRALLARGGSGAGSALESLGGGAAPDPVALPARAADVAEEWHEIVKNFLDDDQELHDVADRIADRGKRALEALAAGDEEQIAGDKRMRADLEVIARLDGSRPTFMVQNGKVNLATSPVGTWEARLNSSAGLLEHAIRCVGRVDLDSLPKRFAGTAFLIQENLVITNRHVLEEIGTQAADGTWNLKDGAAVDFGHEFRARDSVDRRALRKVVFCGKDPINHTVDHGHLDLALIETERPAPADKLDYYLAIDISPDWGARDQELYVVGYPGSPRFGDEDLTLLEKLFKSTYGHKRCAPGVVMRERTELAASPKGWSLAHDATTLGGNSGSAILAFARENICAGLHYGGTRSTPRENWGHVLGLTLDATDGRSAKTLRQHLMERDVDLIDPFGG
jgi:V8-like Glu-specific endopeptidase